MTTVLRFAAAVAVFLGLLLLALSNTEPVTIRMFRVAVFESPLAFVVFAAFAVGVAAGLVAGAVRVARLKRSLDRLRRRERPGPPAPHGAVPNPSLSSGRALPPDAA
jgi:lipopolysaccharide assembly protein A